MNKILHGDCLEILKTLEENSVDSIVTDPPYELGFMGKSWDNTGIANNPLMWAECLRVLKPGGYLLSFGGTRTYHRMAVAIEDAGFEVRDMIEWVYGSGFPKSLNIGKAVDKLQGNEREEFENKNGSATGSIVTTGSGNLKRVFMDSKGTSEWEGWGTALKPAHEPICMARKPLAEKTVAENVLKYGTGGINIDESRLDALPRKTGTKPTSDEATGSGSSLQGSSKNRQAEYDELNLGRFPANLINDNSEEVRECFPETKTGAVTQKAESVNSEYAFSHNMITHTKERLADSGNASRFFKSIIYQAKASKSNRGEGNTHATVKPTALMEYLINMVSREGQIILDPFGGSGTTGVACKNINRNYILIEKEQEYIDIINARLSTPSSS